MSENLDLVRAICADWERGDFSSADWAHPEIEFASPMGVESATFKGTKEMAGSWRETMSAWDGMRVEAEEVRELDGERVLMLYSFSGHGRLSGVDVAPAWTKGAVLFHVGSGKVTRLVIYVNRDRGLADLGLAE